MECEIKKHKILRKKRKEFFKNKKHSKKSKRQKIIHEYEINLSNLLKRLRIDDNTGSENGDLMKHMPWNIFSLKQPVWSRLLKCNLKTYSSYTTSKSLNIYKQSKSKCLRFITIDKYLQSKVSCTPDFHECFKTKSFQIYKGNNFSNVNQKATSLSIKKVVEIQNANVPHIRKGSNSGNFKNYVAKQHSERNRYKMFNDVYSLGNGYQKFDNLQLYGNKRMESLEVNAFDMWDNLYFQSCITLFSKISILNWPSTHNEASTSSSNSNSNFPSLGMDKQVSQTILELFWLELKVKRCISILKVFKFKSDSIKNFENIKKKCSNLIIKHMRLMKGNDQQKDVPDGSNSSANKSTNILSNENDHLDVSNESNSFEKQSTSIISNGNELLNVSDENNSFTKKSTNMLTNENDTLDVSDENNQFVSREKKERTCKRKRQQKDDDDDDQTPKRSKLLDECIMKVSSSKNLPNKENAHVSIVQKSGHNAKENNENYEGADSENANNISKDLNVESFTETMSCEKQRISTDPVDKEVKEILSQLPPLQESLSSPDPSSEKPTDLSNPLETAQYDIGEGKSMIILPYVDIY